MYFKVNQIQKAKYVDMGMINLSADFYLEKGDVGYDKYIAEHLVTVPVIPAGGYQGKMTEGLMSRPIDQDDYDNWIKSLPTVQQLNPFCNHSIQFEHDVTPEEILWCFEWALGITHWNYLMADLPCEKKDERGNPYAQRVNQSINYLARKAYYQGINLITANNRTTVMQRDIEKITLCEAKIAELKKVDFTTISEIYSVK